ATGRPHHRVGDVGVVTAATAEHADRNDLGFRRHARTGEAVVGHFGDRAGHVRAVPRTVACGRTAAAFARRTPVARVPTTRHARVVGAARNEGIGDEVITRQQVRFEIGVVRRARVDDGDDDAGALGDVPRAGDARATGARAVVPRLVGGEVWIVRQCVGVHAAVDGNVLDVRI